MSTDSANSRGTTKQPHRDLINGPKVDYFEYGAPLYDASIQSDWNSAEAILLARPELVRYSITENGETALHVAACANRSKQAVEFVKNLVEKMTKADLELVNKNHSTALYLAAAAGNLETVKIMVDKNIVLPQIPGANGQMLPLYAAALFGNHEVVKYLYKCSKELTDDAWNPQNRGWLLEKCVESDMFDTAMEIMQKYPELGRGSVLGVLARKPEAFSKNKSSITKGTIYSVSALNCLKARTHEKQSDALPLLRIIWEDIVKLPKQQIDDILRGPPDSNKLSGSGLVVQTKLKKLIVDFLDILEKEAHMKTEGAEHFLLLKDFLSDHVVNLLAEIESLFNQYNIPDKDQARETQQLISEYAVRILDETQLIFKRGFGEVQAQQLHKLIFDHIAKMRREFMTIKRTYSNRVMFIAAEVGNTNFLVELFRRSPDLIWKVNDNSQSIFHVAVKNRHEGIYNLLYEIGAMKDMVTPMRDVDDNNMLHLTAISTRKKNLEDVSGAALQMQRELLWFKEVERMIPPSYIERKNKEGFTPRELFTIEHQYLITQGEKWMKSTASQCMVVATLIATIVFAAAFTVPGGYNQNDGIPMFRRKLSFVAFVVADAISLFLSSASILTFLSILTSRYAEQDFERSLPMKLMSGLAALFLSIGTMMVTFSVSFFVLYHKEMKWIPIFISLFAVTPAILYVALQYHLLIDVFRSTYGGKYLFKPANRVLFYENPKY